jgi:pyruvate dehydrogenase E1 component beta subunit
MPIDILMPALSPTMEQGKLSKWLKAEGDKVKAGDIIAEIETDKATMEVEAVDEGILAKILIADGTDNVAVNTPIGVIAAEGEDVSAASKPAAAKPAEKAAEPEPRPRRLLLKLPPHRRRRPSPPRRNPTTPPPNSRPAPKSCT